ncbi:MAG: hypothetical protein E7261_11830 [Lachnospiraceae bacterium]|nr:hypothetical protein [Lachnospiraceae bacterium]
MKRKFRQIIRRALQVCIWFFILYLGANIIARGTKILFDKPLGEIIEDAVEEMTEKLGIVIMKNTGFVFSYLYDEKETHNIVSKIYKKTYLLKESVPEEIVYPSGDNLYGDLLADFLMKKEFEEDKESAIPVITIIPDYYGDGQGEGDSDDEPVGEVISPFIRPLAPVVIGKRYTLSQLMDFDVLLKNFYAVETNTAVNKTILDVAEMLDADMTLRGEDTKYPQILIFHTHSQEAYKDSRPGMVDDTVVGMGAYLAEILERDYGYHVLHITTTFDCINGKLDRSAAYEYAQEALKGILDAYPTIEVVLDLHRDGVNEDVHLVTEYNGKKAAKIMFVNGISRFKDNEIGYLYNPNLAGNLAFSFQLQLKGEAYFPGLMRRTMIKAYRYNLHFLPKSALVELGAQTNTVEEARNAVELLAVMIGEVLQ